MSYGLPVGAVVNCADNTGAKNLYLIAVKSTFVSRAHENPGRPAREERTRGVDDDASSRETDARGDSLDDVRVVA